MGSRLPILKLALVITILLAVAVLSAGQDTGVSAAKKHYARTGYEATLSGRFTLRLCSLVNCIVLCGT